MPSPTSKQEAHYELENSIGYLLNRAAHIAAAKFSDQLKPHNVSLQAWRILATLSELDNQSLSELADHTGAELSYLSRAILGVEEKGLVTRKPSATDKRTVLLSLTPAGRSLVRKLAPQGRAIERLSWANVPDADLQATLRTLRVIYQNLVASTQASSGINKKLTVALRRKKRAQGDSE